MAGKGRQGKKISKTNPKSPAKNLGTALDKTPVQSPAKSAAASPNKAVAKSNSRLPQPNSRVGAASVQSGGVSGSNPTVANLRRSGEARPAVDQGFSHAIPRTRSIMNISSVGPTARRTSISPAIYTEAPKKSRGGDLTGRAEMGKLNTAAGGSQDSTRRGSGSSGSFETHNRRGSGGAALHGAGVGGVVSGVHGEAYSGYYGGVYSGAGVYGMPQSPAATSVSSFHSDGIPPSPRSSPSPDMDATDRAVFARRPSFTLPHRKPSLASIVETSDDEELSHNTTGMGMDANESSGEMATHRRSSNGGEMSAPRRSSTPGEMATPRRASTATGALTIPAVPFSESARELALPRRSMTTSPVSVPMVALPTRPAMPPIPNIPAAIAEDVEESNGTTTTNPRRLRDWGGRNYWESAANGGNSSATVPGNSAAGIKVPAVPGRVSDMVSRFNKLQPE